MTYAPVTGVSRASSSSRQQAPAGMHSLQPCRLHRQHVKISSPDSKTIAQYGHPSPGSSDEDCREIADLKGMIRSVIEISFPLHSY